MSSVGTYVLSTQERPDADVDEKTAGATVLKLLGRSRKTPQTFGALLSLTGFSEELLRKSVDRLRADKLLKGGNDGLVLTDLGYKAHFIVAT